MTRVGAQYQGSDRCEFRVWAPGVERVGLRIVAPRRQEISLDPAEGGYWQATMDGVPPGSRYFYVLGRTMDRTDPASQFQPEGVHGPSEVVDHEAFQWTDAGWEGVPLEDMLIYELHVGTFTPEGTFDAILPRLAELRDLGVTAVELMPVAQFPGSRNWGYDGVYPYAVQNSYGGPNGLKTLVNAIHQRGMAAVLDVVYNHLGPEGNYLRDFGPYFTPMYKTPWGDAINYDQAHSDHVRNFFVENALFWLREYHFDALRLDALHTIYDKSAKHFLLELTEHVTRLSRESGRKYYLIGECDLNDVRLIRPSAVGGYGLDALWADDFHHSLHALLTAERSGYYEDFGSIEQLAKAFREGFVFSWQYSKHRRKFHGSSSRQRPARQFVVFTQNHDQVGNRMLGDRLSQLVDFESLKLAAGALLLSPYVPLLFMGQEYGEDAPFRYFISHSDETLVAAVRKGRREEFRAFAHARDFPDPYSSATFESSKLRWEERTRGRHRILLAFYRRLIRLRNHMPHIVGKTDLTVQSLPRACVLTWHRTQAQGQTQGILNFSDETRTLALRVSPGRWTKVLDSADDRWAGPGAIAPAQIDGPQQITLARKSVVVFTHTSFEPAHALTAARASVEIVEETSDADSGGDL